MDGTEVIETPRVLQIPTSDNNTDSISSAAALQQLNNSLLNGATSPHNFNGTRNSNEATGNTDANGNFTYVMLNSQGQGERNLTQIIPRTNLDLYNSQMSLQSNPNRAYQPDMGIKKEFTTNSFQIQKDMARRQQHNEVERRRRDKINTWINKISKVVPDCSDDHTKQGQVRFCARHPCHNITEQRRNSGEGIRVYFGATDENFDAVPKHIRQRRC